MRIRRVLLACAIVGLLQSSTAVLAQFDNSGSSYGTSSSSSGRQGIFGNRTMGAGASPARSGFGSGSSFGSQGDVSSARYVRGNRQAGDFVGGSAAQDTQHFVGGVPNDTNTGNGMSSGEFSSSMTSGGGYPNSRQNVNRDQQGGGATGQTATTIRVTFRAAFDYPQRDSRQLSTSLTRRLAKTPAIQTQTPIRVELQGRTAILRGIVSAEHDRSLAAQMIRLEPGIEAVRNEIEIESPTPTELTPP
jgi:osmotically-inducible protein OsmY